MVAGGVRLKESRFNWLGTVETAYIRGMRVVCVLEANDLHGLFFEMCEGGYSIGISACETLSCPCLGEPITTKCSNYPQRPKSTLF